MKKNANRVENDAPNAQVAEAAPKAKKLNFEQISDKLWNEGVSIEKFMEVFTALYNGRGITDLKFIEARVKIYRRISERRFAPKTDEK